MPDLDPSAPLSPSRAALLGAAGGCGVLASLALAAIAISRLIDGYEKVMERMGK